MYLWYYHTVQSNTDVHDDFLALFLCGSGKDDVEKSEGCPQNVITMLCQAVEVVHYRPIIDRFTLPSGRGS